MNIGLAVRRISIHKPRHSPSAIFMVVYAGSDALIQDGKPIHGSLIYIDELLEESVVKYDEVGLLIVPPIEVRNRFVVWHIELWQHLNPQRHLMTEMQHSIPPPGFGPPVNQSLCMDTPAAVGRQLKKVGARIRRILREQRAELLLSSSHGVGKQDVTESPLPISRFECNHLAEMDLAILATDGDPPHEV